MKPSTKVRVEFLLALVFFVLIIASVGDHVTHLLDGDLTPSNIAWSLVYLFAFGYSFDVIRTRWSRL